VGKASGLITASWLKDVLGSWIHRIVGFVDIKGPRGALSDFEKTGIPFVHTKDKGKKDKRKKKRMGSFYLFVRDLLGTRRDLTRRV
jgi:hypothetical protein